MNSQPPLTRSIQQQSRSGELPLVELSNSHGRALICLQGGQVIEYQPQDQAGVIWLGQHSRFEQGKAIRGGIPICWPWFGDHPDNPALPAHGLVRTRLWKVLETTDEGDTSSLRLGIEDDHHTRQLWPYKFQLELLIQLGQQLTLTLSSHNPNQVAMPISEALHSYFSVSDISQIRIGGLEGGRYRDKLHNLQPFWQRGPLAITSETDQVYVDTDARVTIDDPVLKRRIIIDKQQSHSTVIWNPWTKKARALADFGDRDYQTMLCVETANVLDNSLLIPSGNSHHLSTTIESVPLDQTTTA
ncbi:MAG: D-hexose-6-phosphate mutarotase [Motiliproteus sp.]